MLKFFHHPVPSEPETVSDWLRSTDNEQAFYLSSLDHLYELIWCSFLKSSKPISGNCTGT